MDKQKEIQDIAWNICAMIGKPDNCSMCSRFSDCRTMVNSENLYNNGFRRFHGNQISLPCMPGDPIFIIDCAQIYKERVTGVLITREGVDIVTRKNTYSSELIGEKIYLEYSDASELLDKRG